ncbi:hypothetical protein V1527DRAFT_496341 [Lipomyces starkeyi]
MTYKLHRLRRIHLAAGESLCSSNSPRTLVNDGHSKYQLEPDGYRVLKAVVEVAFSQTYDSLLEKARNWIFDYERPNRRIALTTCELNRRIELMRLNWESHRCTRGWLCEGFIEVVRIDPQSHGRDALLKSEYVLIHACRNESSNVPQPSSLGNEAASEVVI